MQMFIAIYGAMGFVTALYVLFSHLRCCWQYIKQLYTARYVKPDELKTYFGFTFWPFWNKDPWLEVLGVTTFITVLGIVLAFLAWPLAGIFFLNYSIQKARARIEEEN